MPDCFTHFYSIEVTFINEISAECRIIENLCSKGEQGSKQYKTVKNSKNGLTDKTSTSDAGLIPGMGKFVSQIFLSIINW